MAPAWLLLALAASTVQPPPQPPAGAPPALREIAPGVLEYHGVRLDKKNRRITFAATVNQREGLIEYLLVNDLGKVHESLLATKLAPHDIHLAMLLIGLKGDAGANAKQTVPPDAIDSDYLHSAPKLQGTPVRLFVAWTQGGKRRGVPAEDLILNLQTKRPMSAGTWTYNGSLVENGVFLADSELSIAAVITDPTALVNNPRPGYDNDEIWQCWHRPGSTHGHPGRGHHRPGEPGPREEPMTRPPFPSVDPAPPADRARITDLYFAEARSKLIDLAAFLDRIGRSDGADDFRLKSLRAAVRELGEPGPDKAKKILLVLSDPTPEPLPQAGAKPACGAWAGF